MLALVIAFGLDLTNEQTGAVLAVTAALVQGAPSMEGGPR